MLLKKIKKFKLAETIFQILLFLFITSNIFIFFIILTTPNITPVLAFISSLFTSMLLIFTFNYCFKKLKIMNFNKYFNKDEVMNNLSLFHREKLEQHLITFFKEDKQLIYDNIKNITENCNDKQWLLKIELTIEEGKILLLSKDLDWYSRQVSTRELYLYLQPAINDIIETEQKEYYIPILNIFSDFIHSEQLKNIKDIINVEQKSLIINI